MKLSYKKFQLNMVEVLECVVLEIEFNFKVLGNRI